MSGWGGGGGGGGDDQFLPVLMIVSKGRAPGRTTI